jgi:hypothetical protein
LTHLIHDDIRNGICGGIRDGIYDGIRDGIEAHRLSSNDPWIRAGDCIRIATCTRTGIRGAG